MIPTFEELKAQAKEHCAKELAELPMDDGMRTLLLIQGERMYIDGYNAGLKAASKALAAH